MVDLGGLLYIAPPCNHREYKDSTNYTNTLIFALYIVKQFISSARFHLPHPYILSAILLNVLYKCYVMCDFGSLSTEQPLASGG